MLWSTQLEELVVIGDRLILRAASLSRRGDYRGKRIWIDKADLSLHEQVLILNLLTLPTLFQSQANLVSLFLVLQDLTALVLFLKIVEMSLSLLLNLIESTQAS